MGLSAILCAGLLVISFAYGEEIGSVGVSGKDLVEKAKLLDRSLQIFPDAAFKKYGKVSHISFYASSPGDFWLGIWRPEDKGQLQLVHKVHIQVASKGHHDMWLLEKDRFAVKAGDVFGIHYSKSTEDGVDTKNIISALQSRKGLVKDVKLSRVYRRWHFNHYLDTCKQLNFTKYLWTKRLPLIEVHIERELVTLTNSHKFRGMEIGVVQMKVKGGIKKVCDARSLDEIAEAWGNKACQMINPNYMMVYAETLPDPSNAKVMEEPECPDDDLTKCVEKRNEECEQQHKTEVIGCAESMEAALVPVVVNKVEYEVMSC